MKMLARQVADLRESIQIIETFPGVHDAVVVEENGVLGVKLKTGLWIYLVNSFLTALLQMILWFLTYSS